MTEINFENVNQVDIKKLASNPDFGALNFNEILGLLEKIQSIFKELDELNYSEKLPEHDANIISQKKQDFVKLLLQIGNFTVSQENAPNVRNNIIDQTKNLHKEIFNQFITDLVFLRQEVAFESKDEKNLQEQQKELSKLIKETKAQKEQLQKEIDEFKSKKKQEELEHGEYAVTQLAHHFAQQANDYTKIAEGQHIDYKKIKGNYKKILKKIFRKGGWLKKRALFFWALFLIIIINIVVYIKWRDSFDRDSLIAYGIVKVALILLLYYGMHFSSRNYYIISNLAAINKHRKNVAQTLEDFIKTNPDKEILNQMLMEGTKAMFRNIPTGYNSKVDQDENPITEIVNNIIKTNKNG